VYIYIYEKVLPVHAMRAYGDQRQAPLVLNLDTRWNYLSSTRPRRCAPGEDALYSLIRTFCRTGTSRAFVKGPNTLGPQTATSRVANIHVVRVWYFENLKCF
jgi:hypothetical protein